MTTKKKHSAHKDAHKDSDETPADDRIDDPGDDLGDNSELLDDEENLGTKSGTEPSPSTEPEPLASEEAASEEEIPTRAAKKQRHTGTMRYLVTAIGDVKRDGVYSHPGDVLRLTAEEADELGDAVEMLGSDRDLSVEP